MLDGSRSQLAQLQGERLASRGGELLVDSLEGSGPIRYAPLTDQATQGHARPAAATPVPSCAMDICRIHRLIHQKRF